MKSKCWKKQASERDKRKVKAAAVMGREGRKRMMKREAVLLLGRGETSACRFEAAAQSLKPGREGDRGTGRRDRKGNNGAMLPRWRLLGLPTRRRMGGDDVYCVLDGPSRSLLLCARQGEARGATVTTRSARPGPMACILCAAGAHCSQHSQPSMGDEPCASRLPWEQTGDS